MRTGRLAVLAAFILAVAVTPAAAQETSDTVDTVILASTANYPDALVAGSAAAKIGSPVLLTDQDTLPQETRDALSTLDPSEVVVVGGPAVVSDDVISALQEDHNVTRLWGTTRYGTAVEVAEHFWVEGADEAVLVQNSLQDQNGTVLAAARELAGDGESPVYLTPEGSIPAVVLSSLENLGVEEVTIAGTTVTASYRSSLADIGIEIDEEVTGATEQEVRENIRERVSNRVNASTELVVVATSSYRHSIAATHFPNSSTYHITGDEDIDALVATVNDRNVSSVTVAGQPGLAEDAAERLRSETDAAVRLVVARAAEAIRMNTNLTNENVPAFIREHRHDMAIWQDARERAVQHIRESANRTLMRADRLVDANASDEAWEALREARALFSDGQYVEAREAAQEALNEIHADRYREVRDDPAELQERVQEETEDLEERVDELRELNREFAEEMEQNLTVEERLEIIEEFRNERRERIRELMEEAQETRGDLHERLRDSRERIRERSTAGRYEVELTCADSDVRTDFDISGHDGYLEAEGEVALNTPNYVPGDTVQIDQEAGTVSIDLTFTARDGPGVQCLGVAEAERRVRVDPGNWTVDLTVMVDGEQVHTASETVTVGPDDDTDSTDDEQEDRENETETNETDDEDEADEATVPTSFRLASTEARGDCDTESFYYDGEAVDEITVEAGTEYTVTFAPRQGCTYPSGAEYRSDPRSVFGTSGQVDGGGTTTVTFTADDDFTITQYWPGTDISKADIEVDVR